MKSCGQFATAKDMFAVLLCAEDAARRAFDEVEANAVEIIITCCGKRATVTSYLGCGVRARCLVCGAEIVDVTWPMGPLLYDPATPGCARMPSAALLDELKEKRWLVVEEPVR